MAGGLTEDADPTGVNLALRVEDEAHFFIPRIDDVIPNPSPVPGRVNINTASVEDLQTLFDTGMPLPINGYNGTMGISVEGTLSIDPQRRTSGWQFTLSVERVKVNGNWADSRGDLLVTARPSISLVADRQEPLFRYGDRLIVVGDPGKPPVFQDFDYRDYLARKGIFSTMIYPGVELAGEGKGNMVLDVI